MKDAPLMGYFFAYTIRIKLKSTIYKNYQDSLKESVMLILEASKVRANLYRLIDQTAKSHQPLIITGKRNNAVLISAEDWSSIQEMLHSSQSKLLEYSSTMNK